jgi:hypothetical protein
MTRDQAKAARDLQHWRSLGQTEPFHLGWKDYHRNDVMRGRWPDDRQYMAGWWYAAHLIKYGKT